MSDRDAIEAAYQLAAESFRAKDPDATVAVFTDDAILMPANSPPLVGKDQIRAVYTFAYHQMGDVDVHTEGEIDEIEVAAPWAFLREHHTVVLEPRDGGDPEVDQRTALLILRKQPDGSWKIHRYIWNRPHSAGAPPS